MPRLDPEAVAGRAREGRDDLSFDAAPMAAFRIGYSQPWSLVARRFFVAVEPKIRVIDGRVNVIGAIVIGTGMGY